MYNSYYYEAKSIVPDISLHLSDDYAASAKSLLIIMSIIAFACVLISAIAVKKTRGFGIVVAIAQPLGFFAAYKYVLGYSQIDFSCLATTVTSSVSLDDAMNKLRETLTVRITEEIMPGLLAITPWSFLMLAAFVMTLIYAGMLKKDAGKGKGLAVAALIITIVKYVLFAPINNFALLLGNATTETQTSWDPIYYLFSILPLVFIAIKGILVLTSKPAPVSEPIVEAAPAPEAEATPAAEEKAE